VQQLTDRVAALEHDKQGTDTKSLAARLVLLESKINLLEDSVPSEV
jgi:hypothetical protein